METYIPKKYQDKLFLSVMDIAEILGLCKNTAYNYIKSGPPFKVMHVGNNIRINAISFWKWYSESVSDKPLVPY